MTGTETTYKIDRVLFRLRDCYNKHHPCISQGPVTRQKTRRNKPSDYSKPCSLICRGINKTPATMKQNSDPGFASERDKVHSWLQLSLSLSKLTMIELGHKNPLAVLFQYSYV